MLRIAHYDSETSKTPTVLDITWQDLIDLLSEECFTDCSPCPGGDCVEKRGAAWSPTDIDGDRKDANVKAVTAAVFDLDHLSDDDMATVAARLEPYQYICHSTHSHKPPGDNCVRVVVPLSRAVHPSEWPRVLAAAVQTLQIPADPKCKNVSRLYFTPRSPMGAPRIVETNDGKALDVNALLRFMNAAPAPSDPPPVLEPESVISDLEGLRSVLNDVRKRKLATTRGKDPAKQVRERAAGFALDRLLKGAPIAVPGNFEGESDLPKGRDDALNQAMSTIAWAVPPATLFDAVKEIVRPSIASMAAPEGVDHWLHLAESMYQRAYRRRVSADEERAKSNAAVETSLRNLWEKRRAGTARAPASHSAASEDTDEEDTSWRTLLLTDDGGKLRSVGHNVSVILTFAPEVAGFIRWNEVTRTISVLGGLFEGTHASILDKVVSDWLQSIWSIFPSASDVKSSILRVARDNPHDPLRDYLTSLEWDGVDRIDTWLTSFCRVATTNDAGADISEQVRLMSRRFMIACAARALEPGCKCDTVLILEGDQGFKKSTVFDVLGGAWFSDEKIVVNDKDSKMIAARTWIAELAELTALRRSDVDSQKQFIGQRKDTFRPPYGAAVEDFLRRCVFAGTVNPRADGADYLTDLTGNRRYWPVRVTAEIDADGLRLSRDQLFAEGVARYRAFKEGDFSERWWFELAENLDLECAVTASRVATGEDDAATVMEDAVMGWWNRLTRKPEGFSMLSVATDALNMSADKVKPSDAIRIGRALKQLGFERRRVRDGGRLKWAYYATKAVTSASRPLRPDYIAAVTAAKVRND